MGSHDSLIIASRRHDSCQSLLIWAKSQSRVLESMTHAFPKVEVARLCSLKLRRGHWDGKKSRFIKLVKREQFCTSSSGFLLEDKKMLSKK